MDIDDETILDPASAEQADNRTVHEPEVQHASVTPLVRYHVTKADIENTRSVYAALSCETTEGYESVRKAIAFCRTTRTKVEQRRKELKADSLEWGRKVDGSAKELTALIESIEKPLQAKKDAVDAEKDRVKREAEEAAKREAEAAERAARDAEEARVKAERAALDAEREALAAQRAELERAQSELKEAREKADREEFERQTRIQAEKDAAAQAERDRLAAEEARVAAAERQAELARRLEALKPDAEKLWAFAASINTLTAPEVQSDEARQALDAALAALVDVTTALDGFGRRKPQPEAA